MIAEPTGTDGRPIIRKTTSVTGRREHPGSSLIFPRDAQRAANW